MPGITGWTTGFVFALKQTKKSNDMASLFCFKLWGKPAALFQFISSFSANSTDTYVAREKFLLKTRITTSFENASWSDS